MTHETPLSTIAFQKPDGTSGELNIHDNEAIHNEAASVKETNIAANAVTSGKIANNAVVAGKIANDAVTTECIEDKAVTKDKLSQDLQDSWDSISQVNEINQDGVRIVFGHGVATVSVTKTVSAPVWSTTRIATVPEPYRPSCSIGCVLLYAANNTFTPFPTTVYPDGGIAVSVYSEAINGEIYGSVTYPVA